MSEREELRRALETLIAMLAEWHADCPEHVGDKEAAAIQSARDLLRRPRPAPPAASTPPAKKL